MLKRIHSDRDPRDTLYSELKKEFGTYFQAGRNTAQAIFRRRPKCFFCCMIFLMLASMILSFPVLRDTEKPQQIVVKHPYVAPSGLDRILEATGQIREHLALRKLVDSLSAKKQLSSADSALLDSALNRMGPPGRQLPLIH